MNSRKKEHPWVSRFLEIASKAVMKTHLEYANWSIGQAGVVDKKKRFFSKSIQGIELADETVVCAQITIEALCSPLFSGDFVDEDDEPRYYKINREVKYFNSRDRVDITVQRYMPKTDKLDKNWNPVYIEAKRVVSASINNLSAGNAHKYTKNIPLIIEDMEKLKGAGPDKFKNILVWGNYMPGSKRNATKYTPESFLNELNKDMKSMAYLFVGYR